MRYDKVWRDQYGNDITTIGNRNPMPWALEGEQLMEYIFLICGGRDGAFSPKSWGTYALKNDEYSDSLFERLGVEGFRTDDFTKPELNILYDNFLVPWARKTGYFYLFQKDKYDHTHKIMVDVFVEALIEAKALKTEAEWIQYFGIDKTNITEIGSEKFEFYVKNNCFEKYDKKLYQRIKDDKTILNAIEDEIRYFSNPKNGWVPERTLIKLAETDSEMEEYEKRLEEDERNFDINNQEVDFFKEDNLHDEFIEI